MDLKALDKYQDYLLNKKFTNSLHFKVSDFYLDKPRIHALGDLCENKKVIHLGCVDHIPLIKEKIENNQWLHKIITDKSSECIGVDINLEGVQYIQNLGFENVICKDILEDDIPEISNGDWDVLVIGEILEHVDNPVHFLNVIKKKYSKNIKQMVITIPNVLNKQVFSYLMNQQTELINSDHRYWFSPYTALRVVSQSGFTNPVLSFHNRIPLTKFELIKRKFTSKKHYPFYYFQTLVVTANFSE